MKNILTTKSYMAFGITALLMSLVFISPKISNADSVTTSSSQIVNSIGDSWVLLTWQTDMPTTTSAWYHIVAGNGTGYTGYKTTRNTAITSTHSLLVKNLENDSRYVVIVGGTNANDRLVQSSEITFMTKNENSPMPSDYTDSTGDLIVYNLSLNTQSYSKGTGRGRFTWKSNKPSKSYLLYSFSSDFPAGSRIATHSQLSSNHSFNLNHFERGKYYFFKAISEDILGVKNAENGILYIQ